METWSIVTLLLSERICHWCQMKKTLLSLKSFRTQQKLIYFQVDWTGRGLNYAVGLSVFHGPLGYETHSTYREPCKMSIVAILKRRLSGNSSLTVSNYDWRDSCVSWGIAAFTPMAVPWCFLWLSCVRCIHSLSQYNLHQFDACYWCGINLNVLIPSSLLCTPSSKVQMWWKPSHKKIPTAKLWNTLQPTGSGF